MQWTRAQARAPRRRDAFVGLGDGCRAVITEDRRGLYLVEAQALCARCPVRPADAPTWRTVEWVGGIRTVSGAKRAGKRDAALVRAYCNGWRRVLGWCGLQGEPVGELPRFFLSRGSR